MSDNGANEPSSQLAGPRADKELRNLARLLCAWCDSVGVAPSELAERAERIKHRWFDERGMSKAQLKRFGSSRPHFYRLLKGQIPVNYNDQEMLKYLSENRPAARRICFLRCNAYPSGCEHVGRASAAVHQS
jgi:hypothetical protein